jgi:hypothetical protein
MLTASEHRGLLAACTGRFRQTGGLITARAASSLRRR